MLELNYLDSKDLSILEQAISVTQEAYDLDKQKIAEKVVPAHNFGIKYMLKF